MAVLDPRSPLGHRNILSDVTVKLDWGKMCVIMGAKDSGKSSLLHILSGADNRPTTKISGSNKTVTEFQLLCDSYVCASSGSVLFDGRPTDPTARPWHRGGYVEALDDHFRFDCLAFHRLQFYLIT